VLFTEEEEDTVIEYKTQLSAIFRERRGMEAQKFIFEYLKFNYTSTPPNKLYDMALVWNYLGSSD